MKSVIQTITVITYHGVLQYSVGEQGIIRIVDESSEWEDRIHSSYTGYNERGNPVFTIENAPVGIEYVEVEDGSFRALRHSQFVTIQSDVVSQKSLEGMKGHITRINNEHEIVVKILGKFPNPDEELPFSLSELSIP